ncbi:MAG: hypothetical protein U0992_06485 [Planctomycetaceae bacterium]
MHQRPGAIFLLAAVTVSVAGGRAVVSCAVTLELLRPKEQQRAKRAWQVAVSRMRPRTWSGCSEGILRDRFRPR